MVLMLDVESDPVRTREPDPAELSQRLRSLGREMRSLSPLQPDFLQRLELSPNRDKRRCGSLAQSQLDWASVWSRAHSSETHSKTIAIAICRERPRLMTVSKLAIKPLFSSSLKSPSEGARSLKIILERAFRA